MLGTLPRAAVDQLLRDLTARFGVDRVIVDPDRLARFPGFTWLRPRRNRSARYPLGLPAAVVQPRDTNDVAEVMRQASAAGVPVVPQGAATGVMGGALPIAGGIVLDLGSLNRIQSIEVENRLAWVEAGVLLGDLASAAEERGLLFAHDPWSQPLATVGGAISTSGVGYLAAGYGMMGDQVRGLEVVLPTGEVVAWSGAAKASAGQDLWRLFIGAEGTLGVVTAAAIQLFPWPEERALASFRFATFAEGFRAIERIESIGLRPAMIDYEETGGPPLGTPAVLNLAFDGPREVVAAALRRAGAECRAQGGVNRGHAAAKRFWATRHDRSDWYLDHVARAAAGEVDLEDATDELRPEGRYEDVFIPPDHLLAYCDAVVEIARRHEVAVHSFGIWGRAELLSYMLEGLAGPTESPLDEALDEALLLARQLGGSIETVHGLGVRQAHLLPAELGSAFTLLRRVKSALDPATTLNPGKLGFE